MQKLYCAAAVLLFGASLARCDDTTAPAPQVERGFNHRAAYAAAIRHDQRLRPGIMASLREQLKDTDDPQAKAAIQQRLRAAAQARGRMLWQPLDGPFRVGQSGRLFGMAGAFSYTVDLHIINIVDGEALAEAEYTNNGDVQLVWLRGFDLSGATSGTTYVITCPVTIAETHSYTTVIGGRETVPVIQPLDLSQFTSEGQ